ncbi:MAG: hypothetical protein M4D80_36020 [Myxococcota bacterium]|nr:hypothetical protein [Deltaproteobacteria bacterium]MDQ3340596.1 hypothetical protein [Myxococcota bacterium]
MSGLNGVLVVIMLWAGLLAWTAKVAQAQGRSPLLWALIAGLIGGASFAMGLLLFEKVIDLEASTALMLLTFTAPLVLMAGSMTALVFALRRGPIHVANAKTWPVHFVDRGEGKVRFHGGGKVAFEWRDGSREAGLQNIRAQADGECVRIKIEDTDELCLMPMGKPETPAGRRQQSLKLAGMLRSSHVRA